jgi:nitrogen-specific signal transduction histidine kinase
LVIDDISEQRRLQRRLERADRAAQRERLASVGMLAASVAHEINNPLGYISANLELLNDTLCSAGLGLEESLGAQRAAALKSSVEDAQQGVERVRNIVLDLRGFTRVEQGDALKPVWISDVVEAALGLAGHELKHRAQVVRDLRPLPLVLANEGQLCQVFLNLLINAAHAIPLGQIEGNTVTVRSWEEPEALCVEIRDSGAGIPPDVLPHIFEPFHSTKPNGEGAGLGLPVSLRIMQGMGGSVQAYSEPGQGSRFVVRLPRSVQISEPTAEPLAERAASAVSDPVRDRGAAAVLEPDLGTGPRLLLVDDEPLLLRAMSRLLSPRFGVTTATSGRQALELLEAGQDFDLIVSDLMMPDLSGMDLFDWLCAHHPQHAQRMIFLTGGAMNEESGAFLDRFPERSLRKPVSRVALLSAVERALER